jgi:hypothetical protein
MEALEILSSLFFGPSAENGNAMAASNEYSLIADPKYQKITGSQIGTAKINALFFQPPSVYVCHLSLHH